jgi:hypothetical protein
MSALRRDKSDAKASTSDAQVQLAGTRMHLHDQSIAALATSAIPLAGARRPAKSAVE